jgi:hypothetical protein
MELPPHDPNEPGDSEPDGDALPGSPTVIFAGPPSREQQRLADAILAARPGVLFVV